MKNLFLVVAVIFSGLTLFTCSTDKQPPDRKELLTSKTWVVKAKTIVPTVSIGGIVISDILILESDGMRNYAFKYNMDGTLIQYNQMNTIIMQTKWSFNADETEITHEQPIIYNYPIVGDLNITKINVKSITADQLIALIPFLYEETNYVVTITFISK